MGLFKWEQGRQGTGYQKMKLFHSKRFKMDCYLIRIGQGVSIPPHKDPVEEGKHYRLNLTLRKAKQGGMFVNYGNPIFERWRISFFRPDIDPHFMTKVMRGSVLLLSIGKVI